MFNKCPGSLSGTPTIKIKYCPECGSEVEVFSNDVSVNCDHCGFTVYNDVESCIQWCKYAKSCVGEELYRKLKRKRIAFIDQDNSQLSILAEALAKELNESPKLGFVSAGINPAESVDPKVKEVLKEENIKAKGKPKDLRWTGQVDAVVLLDPELEVPDSFGNDIEVYRWGDLPVPGENGLEDYRALVDTLKERVGKFLSEVDNYG